MWSGDLRDIVAATTVGGRLRFVGRCEFRAFRYRPQALHMVAPWGDRLHSGVRVVPQLLFPQIQPEVPRGKFLR